MFFCHKKLWKTNINDVRFYKKNVKFNRIEVYILYDNVDDKFISNKEAKEFFQK